MNDVHSEIPTAMIAAAAQALHEHALAIRPVAWDALPEHARVDFRKAARAVLAAAFAECEVAEEVLWSATATSPQSWVAVSKLLSRKVGYGARHARRLVITTPAVVVTPPEGDQPWKT